MAIYSVISALESEIEQVYKSFENKYEYEVNGVKFIVAKREDDIFVFCISGVGKTNAAMASTILFSNFNVKYCLNIGICGALKKELKFKTYTLVSDIFFIDVDVTCFGYELGQIPKEKISYKTAPVVNKTITDSFKELDIPLHFLSLGTVDSFLKSENDFIKYPAITKYDLDLVDMEAASIATVASKFGVPFSSLKYISDNVTDQNNENQYEQVKEKVHDIKKIMNQVYKMIY